MVSPLINEIESIYKYFECMIMVHGVSDSTLYYSHSLKYTAQQKLRATYHDIGGLVTLLPFEKY